MCNLTDKARSLCTKRMREQDHRIAQLWAQATDKKIDRFEYTQQCAMARARRLAFAEILEVLE